MNGSFEKKEISNVLAKKSKILSQLVMSFNFVESDFIPTACVNFNTRSREPLYISYNPYFWDKLSAREKAAIVAHELLHVILNHGARFSKNNKVSKIENVCMDICVNEILKNEFDFHPENCPVLENAVYLEKIDKSLESGRCFEYYYKKILNSDIDMDQFTSGSNHDWLEKIGNLGDEQLKRITDWLKQNGIDTKELQKLIKNLKHKYSAPGTEPGNLEKALSAEEEEASRKINWQNVLRKISKRFDAQNVQEESWFEQPRRRDWQADYFIPSTDSLCETIAKRDVHIFMDTSGSCSNWSTAFMASAASFPENKFNVFLYNFDTTVHKIDKKTKNLFGYGGTSFKCISDYVNKNIKKYDAIIILTDGYGDYAEYKKPRLWHWVLTEYNTSCIPEECKKYYLQDLQ